MKNIIFIMSDDQGRGDVGYLGSPDMETPNIDAFAAEATRLDSFHATPVCTATRVAFMAGVHAHRVGLADNTVRPWRFDVGLPLDRPTLADRLKSVGYKTFLIGKWHLGMGSLAYYPLQRGFDVFFGFAGESSTYTPPYSWFGEPHLMEGNSPATATGTYLTDELTDRAVHEIENHDFSAQPMFMYVPYNAPHSPVEYLQSDYDHFTGIADVDRRENAAMIRALDRGVGGIIQAVKDAGQWDNTIVVFTSDNGGDEGLFSHGDNGILRGGKWQTYNGGTMTVCVAHFPGENLPSISNAMLKMCDFHKTFLDEAGLSAIPTDGVNMLPLIKGEKQRRYMLTHADELGMAFYFGPASAHGTAESAARFSPPDTKFIINGTRQITEIPTTMEAYAVSDVAETTNIASSIDLTNALDFAADIRAQMVEPQSRVRDGGKPPDFVPPTNWMPAS